jgi:hypothetical protein
MSPSAPAASRQFERSMCFYMLSLPIGYWIESESFAAVDTPMVLNPLAVFTEDHLGKNETATLCTVEWNLTHPLLLFSWNSLANISIPLQKASVLAWAFLTTALGCTHQTTCALTFSTHSTCPLKADIPESLPVKA